MKLPIGSVEYDLRLVRQRPLVDGRPCRGCCDFERELIKVYRHMSARRRISTAWHEIAHAWQHELDVHQAEAFGDEAMCNLIGLAMSQISAQLAARLHCYLVTGIESDHVLMYPGLGPIPFLTLDA